MWRYPKHSFPFRLKGDPVGCGYPAYELSCVNNKTILEYDPGTYYVKNISYNELSIHLIDTNFANGSCSLPSGSIDSVDELTEDFPYRPLGHLSYINSVDVKFPSYEDVMKVLQAGFNLGWLAELPYCPTYDASFSSYLHMTLKCSGSIMYGSYVSFDLFWNIPLGWAWVGSVYKGQLPDGCLIAVKMLENSRFRGTEFINEVRKIGRIRHANVLQLVGFCSEGYKQALVYEYMPNGSLAKHLSSKEGRFQSFKWEKLHEFALGISQGIEYLHKGSDVCILHLEMKAQNVLLDHNFIPKISNAGLAKFYQEDCDFVFISTLRGTAG
ncbi:unnamed protein product, partial [Prunus brigantina]